MSLEIGLKNHEEAKYGSQIGFVNKTEYPNHVFQLGGYNRSEGFRGVQIGVVNDENGNSMFDDFYGLQIGLGNIAEETLFGVQAGGLNVSEFKGVQAGLINVGFGYSGIQLGVINASPPDVKDSKGLQFGGVNIAECKKGTQIAAINYANEMGGVQLGLLNMVGKEFNGLQIGAICHATKGNYFQLGVITCRGDEQLPWYKRISPLVGWHIDEEKPVEEKKEEPTTPSPNHQSMEEILGGENLVSGEKTIG